MRISTAEYNAMLNRTMKAIKSITPEDAFTGREADLHRSIEDDLKARRYYYVHSRTDKRTTTQLGVVDFIIAAPFGKVAWVEVKVGNNKLSSEQNITKHCLLALGHAHYVVRSFAEFQNAMTLMSL